MNIFRKIKAFLVLYKAVEQADAAYRQHGRRFFVMPIADGKLMVMDRYDLRRLKVKHYLSKDTNVHTLLSDSFYFTPMRNGLEEIHPQDRKRREIAYYKWYDLKCKLRRIERRKSRRQR